MRPGTGRRQPYPHSYSVLAAEADELVEFTPFCLPVQAVNLLQSNGCVRHAKKWKRACEGTRHDTRMLRSSMST